MELLSVAASSLAGQGLDPGTQRDLACCPAWLSELCGSPEVGNQLGGLAVSAAGLVWLRSLVLVFQYLWGLLVAGSPSQILFEDFLASLALELWESRQLEF